MTHFKTNIFCGQVGRFLVLTLIAQMSLQCDRVANFDVAGESARLASRSSGKNTFTLNREDIVAEVMFLGLGWNDLTFVSAKVKLRNNSYDSLLFFPRSLKLGDNAGPFQLVNLEVEGHRYDSLNELILVRGEQVQILLRTERDSKASIDYPRLWFHLGGLSAYGNRDIEVDTIWFETL